MHSCMSACLIRTLRSWSARCTTYIWRSASCSATCFCSMALVNSLEKVRCVMDTSVWGVGSGGYLRCGRLAGWPGYACTEARIDPPSRIRWNSRARAMRLVRIWSEICSRFESSSSALYCACVLVCQVGWEICWSERNGETRGTVRVISNGLAHKRHLPIENDDKPNSTHHDGLENLVPDTGQHPLVEVNADLRENLGQLLLHGPREHTQRNVDVLQVLGPRHGVDDARLAPHVEEVGRLKGAGGFDGRICYLLYQSC